MGLRDEGCSDRRHCPPGGSPRAYRLPRPQEGDGRAWLDDCGIPVRLAEVAAINPAVTPAVAPPMVRAIYQTIGMISKLNSAISVTTQTGSPLPSHAAGRMRS